MSLAYALFLGSMALVWHSLHASRGLATGNATPVGRPGVTLPSKSLERIIVSARVEEPDHWKERELLIASYLAQQLMV